MTCLLEQCVLEGVLFPPVGGVVVVFVENADTKREVQL